MYSFFAKLAIEICQQNFADAFNPGHKWFSPLSTGLIPSFRCKLAVYFLASPADSLRDSSRVPHMGEERMTNPLESLRGRLFTLPSSASVYLIARISGHNFFSFVVFF